MMYFQASFNLYHCFHEGAQFIEKLALFYDNLYNEMGPVCTNKKCHNALSLFCQLYNFKVKFCWYFQTTSYGYTL